MKVFLNTYNKELGGEMKSVYEHYFKTLLEIFQKTPPFRENYVKYLEKNSI